MEPNVLYEDDDVVVIDKPAGLIVHSDGRTEEPSVAEWAARAYPAMTDVGESWTSPQGEVVPRPGIVHRLDRSTSGVMVLAKTAEAHAFLKAEFQDRRAKKEYRAFVYGRPRESRGTIEAEIVRIRSAGASAVRTRVRSIARRSRSGASKEKGKTRRRRNRSPISRSSQRPEGPISSGCTSNTSATPSSRTPCTPANGRRFSALCAPRSTRSGSVSRSRRAANGRSRRRSRRISRRRSAPLPLPNGRARVPPPYGRHHHSGKDGRA